MNENAHSAEQRIAALEAALNCTGPCPLCTKQQRCPLHLNLWAAKVNADESGQLEQEAKEEWDKEKARAEQAERERDEERAQHTKAVLALRQLKLAAMHYPFQVEGLAAQMTWGKAIHMAREALGEPHPDADSVPGPGERRAG